jgi:hypothetical protein
MIAFAVQILSNQNRSAVGRHSIDFLLGLNDVPVEERDKSLINEAFFFDLLQCLLFTCKVPEEDVPGIDEDEDAASDVFLFRNSTDGPGDLFCGVFGMLRERFLQELLAVVSADVKKVQFFVLCVCFKADARKNKQE